MTKEDLLELGFKKLYHYTIMNNLIYDLGRNRQLSIGNVGTPNEMMFITETNVTTRLNDVVVLHNYDYDGHLTIDKVKGLIHLLDGTN